MSVCVCVCALAASFAYMKDIGLTTFFLYSEIYWIMCFTYVNFLHARCFAQRENKNKLRACEYEFLFSLQNKFISCEIN